MYFNVSTHSRPKAAGAAAFPLKCPLAVSTHSRPKAAGIEDSSIATLSLFQHTAARRRLAIQVTTTCAKGCFNTQPPEGGWGATMNRSVSASAVSTHSRPKAAGKRLTTITVYRDVSTHSRPKAAGYEFCNPYITLEEFQHTAARRRLGFQYHDNLPLNYVSTHSRPKAAGTTYSTLGQTALVSTHSRPKAAGRPLHFRQMTEQVSTHSRPKAAGRSYS